MFPYHRSPSPQPVGRIRMWTLALGVTFGFLAFSKSDPVPELSRGCSFMGVFHVEGRSRYSLTFKQAKQLCLHLSATLPDKEQIIKAYEAGMETCRYGWIDNRTVVILRHTSHSNCASNLTGAIFYDEVSDMQYDAYCYNKSDLLKKNCDLVVRPLKPEDSSTIPDHSFTTDTPGGLFTLDPSPAIVYPRDTSDPRPVSSVTTAAEQTMETTPGIIEPTAQSNSGEAPDTHKKQNHPIKEWVIILIVILAVALILLVCFAVSFRKSLCGKHAVLTIASEEPSESKAATAKGQEMVTLINEEGVQKNSSVDESKFITTSTKKERVA